MTRPWTCSVCDTSNNAADVVCRWCGARPTATIPRRDRALYAAIVAHPFPPTPAPAVDLASPSVDGAGAGVGSPPSGPTLTDRITRDVVRLLSHPLTSASARVAVVGVSVVGWSYFFAVAVLP